MRIQHQESDLDEVIRFYAEQFKPKEGEKIVKYEFLIDTYRRQVAFKLYVDDLDRTHKS